jgi:hypothetical protein
MDLSTNEVGYLCEKTNFRLCRLAGVIENNGCDYSTITGTDGDPFIIDIITIVLAIVVFAFYIIFLNSFKEYPIKFQNQRATRGKLFYKTHLILMGISALVWGIEHSLIPIDGKDLHFFIILRYVFLNAGEIMLLFIALIDSQLMPANMIFYYISLGVSVIIGLLSFMMFSESLAKNTIAIFGIGIPAGCAIFHFFSMTVVCIFRRILRAIGYTFLMLIFNFLPIIFEIFLNEPLCNVSVGYFSGSSLAILIFAFYRVFISLFYPILKKNERVDGLGNERKLLKGPDEDDSDLPAIIDLDDYPYDYTYSETSDSLLRETL